MLFFIYMFILIISGGFFLAIQFNKKIEQTIVINIMIIIGILYLFGLFDILKIGVYFVQALEIAVLLFSLIKIVKHKQIIKDNLLTPGFLVFILFYGFLIVLNHGRLFYNWDEFSHWGSVIKSMFYINDFSTNQTSGLLFRSYLPAMSLFQYFFECIRGDFVEYYAYISYQVFMISFFIPFIKDYTWKDWRKIILTIPILFLTPIIFTSSYYSSIYIDTSLGICFAYL